MDSLMIGLTSQSGIYCGDVPLYLCQPGVVMSKYNTVLGISSKSLWTMTAQYPCENAGSNPVIAKFIR